MKKNIYLEKKKEYIGIEFMTYEHIEEAMKLREQMYETIEDERIFAPAVREDFVKAIEDGFGLICQAQTGIIACLLCNLEKVEYGVDRNYQGEIMEQCADYVDVYVDKEYRGNGIQNLLEEKMVQLCRENGKKIIIGTVSPDNEPSYHNFKKAGYVEVDHKKKYGGLDRIFMEKRLDETD
ncbi:MAG: GNAT family N-acetyltransferase [Christensenellaceae bacterium]